MTPAPEAIAARACSLFAEYTGPIREPRRGAGRMMLAQVLLTTTPVTHRSSDSKHGLLTLKPDSRAPARSVLTGHESIHLLCIDLHDLSDALRAAIELSNEEQLDWLDRASERSRTLVVLLTKSTFMFYTTDRDRRVTLRPVLETLAKRVRELPDLGKIRTIEHVGFAAAHHLLNYAVECASVADGSTDTTSEIHDAIALSTASSTLGPTLASLFHAAANVVRRVRQETILNDPNAGPSLREIESFAAERIVQEELATWQSQEAALERATDQLPPISQRCPRPFESLEPASEVRLRVAQSINPRISFLPDRKQSVS